MSTTYISLPVPLGCDNVPKVMQEGSQPQVIIYDQNNDLIVPLACTL